MTAPTPTAVSAGEARWIELHGDVRLLYGKRFIAVNQPKRRWYRLPLCFLNLCSGRLAIDDKGLWFVCGTCGRVSHHMARGYEH